MKRSVIKYTTSCTLLFGCWYSIWLFSYFLCSISDYNLHIDSRLAHDEQDAITKSIKEWGMRNSFGSSFNSHLFHSFPYIDILTARLLPQGLMYCTVTAQKPEWNINETLLLLADRSIVNASLYQDSITQELPALLVPKVQDINELIPVISLIPQKLAQGYALTVYHENDIVLVDRQHQNFSIRIDQENIKQFNPDQCNRIKEDLIERKLLSPRRRWVVDARFNNQLVVRSFKGVEK